MGRSKILLLTEEERIADLSDQQLRINEKRLLHKRNPQLYYFYRLLVYFDYSFFLLPLNVATIRYNAVSYIISPSSVMATY